MAKVLISYQFDRSEEHTEDLWVYRKFPSSWNGKTNIGRTIIFTLALDSKDALFLSLTKKLCETPEIWQNVLTTGGVS